MLNFDQPYLARGPREFWARWHISLSTWFRDYVYVPLGGSRRGFPRELGNIMVTFVLSGLWHGASWNYIVWGAYHGLLLVGSRLATRLLPKPAGALATRARPPADRRDVPAGARRLADVPGDRHADAAATPVAGAMGELGAGPRGRSGAGADAAAVRSAALRGRRVGRVVAPPARPGRRSPAPNCSPPGVAGVSGRARGLLLAGMLLFRSRASLDFIYFQF